MAIVQPAGDMILKLVINYIVLMTLLQKHVMKTNFQVVEVLVEVQAEQVLLKNQLLMIKKKR